MGKIIDEANLTQHNVKKFKFASLSLDEKEKKTYNPVQFSKESKTTQEEVIPDSTQVEESPADELLQKIDSLTSTNITLTMELETLKKEFDEKLKQQTEEAYQKGKEEGVKDTQETLQEHNDDLNIQLVKSITVLDEQVQKHETFLSSLEEELVDASIILAKKVIKKELDENSQEVAQKLAEIFLNDLKEASTVTLKVNPKDALYIQEHFKEKKTIMIEADDAINKGGIIILSDIGNIDGNINTRLEKAIALIKREG